MIKVAHIYADSNSHNSGDVILSISTKKYFEEIILDKQNIEYTNICCRNKENFNKNNIEKLNDFDYILVGGGGLILPDTYNNKVSCWQWIIDKDCYSLIKKPIYVLSIGYNLFYNQNINMFDRDSNKEDKERYSIFIENISTLIKKSTHFSLRHKNDVKIMNNLLENKFKDKIKYEMCPSVWYSEKYWKNKMNKKEYVAIEIKDDREWRRYYNIKKEHFYNELKKFVEYCLNYNIKVCVLFHDKSKNFYNYLKKNNITIPFLSNCSKSEEEIYENYSKIHTILCTAGHSQMISHALGINIISLITHPKLENFCDEINDDNGIKVNYTKNIFEEIKKNYNLIQVKSYIYNNLVEKTLNPHLFKIKEDIVSDNILSFGRDNKNNMGYQVIFLYVINELKKILGKENLKMLDIGGGRGYGEIFSSRDDIDYYALDLNEKKKEDNITFLQGDITSNKLNFNTKFDIIFTKDTYEHILNPWDSTNNIINNLVDEGMFLFMAPFSWRYHASPYDTYRYSHTGVQYLFERNNKLKKVFSGYQVRQNRNGFWKNKKDLTMNNNKKFLECIETIYIGQKNENYIFDLKNLNSDMSINHTD
jgi:hypothetical protein